MGVDAEMFVRIKGREHWLSDADELGAAYDLASTLGSDNFMITLGEYPDQPTWEHHALSIMRPVADASDAEDNGLDAKHVGRVAWTQDGDPIFAADDEQLIKIHLWTRYYGEDYARGDWPTIRAVAEWCELRFPGAEIWYGGDSSGICAAPLTRARRDQLNEFYLTKGRKPYTRDRGWDSVFAGGQTLACPICKVGMITCGGGQGDTFWYCDGCDKKAVTSPAGTQWLKHGVGFFDRHKEQQATS